MADILVVDDDNALCEMLVEHLKRSGHSADGATTLTAGLEKSQSGNFDVIFLDVQMPDGNGLDYIPRFKAVSSGPEVIIITGKGDADGAIQAISSGAWSYIGKPHVVKDLVLHLTRALQYREEKKRIQVVPIALKRDNIIGSSPQITACLDQIAQAASCDASVLITGETGTGKEIFAQAVHENSSRAKGNFVVVDCASLPENLIESTLFGHAKGAFTGADVAREGLIKHADGGTLFLDEVGELPLALQKRFLRVLQEHSYRPVGESKEITSNFRVIAATNRNLDESIHSGAFRNDLLFRLQAIWIKLPPLRDRIKDIRDLTTFYVEKLCNRYGLEVKGISPDFVGALCLHDWPGNVRELFQTLENVIAYAIQHQTLFAKHLPEYLRILQAQSGIKSASPDLTSLPGKKEGSVFPEWKVYKNNFEEKYVQQLMLHANGKMKSACEISGLSRTRLYQLVKKYDPGRLT